jgi:hypothetical protein
MGESRLDRSERYWHMASEAFHDSFEAKNEESKNAFLRIAMGWAALASALEAAEAESYWATIGSTSPLRTPVRYGAEHGLEQR